MRGNDCYGLRESLKPMASGCVIPRTTPLLLLGFMLGPAPLSAETIYLKNGQVVEGDITYETGNIVRILEDLGVAARRTLPMPPG